MQCAALRDPYTDSLQTAWRDLGCLTNARDAAEAADGTTDMPYTLFKTVTPASEDLTKREYRLPSKLCQEPEPSRRLARVHAILCKSQSGKLLHLQPSVDVRASLYEFRPAESNSVVP